MNKPPAFQFYATDFLQGTTFMTCAEVGAYIRLLSHSWASGPITKDANQRARLIGADPPEAERIWKVICVKFLETPKGFVNARLERVRNDRDRFAKVQSRKAKQSWVLRRQSKNGSAVASHKLATGKPYAEGMISDLQSSVSISRSEDLKIISSAPAQTADAKPTDDSPIVFTYPTTGKGGSEWHLRQDALERLRAFYPDLDVLAECRRALAWCEANQAKRKTAGGMSSFLTRWLNAAVNRPQASNYGSTSAPHTRTGDTIDAGKASLARRLQRIALGGGHAE